ncbi:MAG TPA: hypothetical protein VMW75_03180 [Thermoanaerobaculia bacterium]|nr:hypothetical protein [Thermoanaerobaculia bacterium]
MSRRLTRLFLGALLLITALGLDSALAAADASGCSFTAGGGVGRRLDDNTGQHPGYRP